MTGYPFKWTPERLSLLSALWNQGQTADIIGKELGTTKNSVIGKARRLNLKKRKTRTSANVVRITSKVKQKPEDRIKFVEATRAQAFSDKKKNLIDLENHECHWPIGDPKSEDFHFCSANIARYPYCEKHRQVAYQKSRMHQ